MGWKVMHYKVQVKDEGSLSQASSRGLGEGGKDLRYLEGLITSLILKGR